MKSSLSKGISLRNSKRKRRSLGKRRYNELEDKKDYFTKYNIKYETIEKKVKEKKKPKIRSIKITSVSKESSKKESSKKGSSKKEDIDLLALLDDNVFKKEEKKESLPKEELSPKEDIADLSDFDDTTENMSKEDNPPEDNSPEDNPPEDKEKVKQEGGYDPNVKKIFVQNIVPEADKGQLIL